MSNVAQNIMDNQESDRLWLPVKPEMDAYVREVAAHACRPLDTFPPFAAPNRSDEIQAIDCKIDKLRKQRRELVGDIPGEITLRGLVSRRRKDGSMPFSIMIPGLVGPVKDTSNIPIRIDNIWSDDPTGDDSHQVILGMQFSAGRLGEQKLRMSLDFIQRRDETDEEDYETNRQLD